MWSKHAVRSSGGLQILFNFSYKCTIRLSTPGVKQSERETDTLLPFSPEVKNVLGFISACFVVPCGMVLGRRYSFPLLLSVRKFVTKGGLVMCDVCV